MSYSFHLNNARKLKFSDIAAQAGLGDLKFVDGYPKPEDDRWPHGFTYVYRNKVTARTLEVEYDGDHFQVCVFTASSAEDYDMAIKLVGAVAKICKARITPEDQETMNLADFEQQFDVDWVKSHSNHALNAVFDMFGNSLEKKHQVSGVTGLMTIGPKIYQQVTEDPDALADAFFYRLKKLNYLRSEGIHQSLLVVADGQTHNTRVRQTSYAQGTETLLYDLNSVVGLTVNDTSMLKVGLSALVKLLPGQAVWLSEELLLAPALNDEQWQALLQQAESVELQDLSAYSYDPDNDPHKEAYEAIAPREGLTAEELETLVYAPIAIFCLVAGADKKIDSKEISAFQRELVKGVTTESKTLQVVMMEAVSDFKQLVTYLLSDEVDIDSIVKDIVRILDNRLDEAEATSFKITLLRIGQIVAEASVKVGSKPADFGE
ncbi:MAG: hypothetical protein MJK04_25280, partial [Psychrosphaera sp.]|nr:hypothetical protein [Psychrosphaera sp.]